MSAKDIWVHLFRPPCYGKPNCKVGICARLYLNHLDAKKETQWVPCRFYIKCIDVVWKKYHEQSLQKKDSRTSPEED